MTGQARGGPPRLASRWAPGRSIGRAAPLRLWVALLASLAWGCLPEFQAGDDDDESGDDDAGPDDDDGGPDDDASTADDDTGSDDDASPDDDTTSDDDSTPSDADADGDGVTAAAGDCEDSDPLVFPYAWEDTTDGIDNDCDGLTDYADGDPVHRLDLMDDQAVLLEFSSFTLPFCGDEYTSVWFSSNGRLTLDYENDSYLEADWTFVPQGSDRSIAAYWDDLNPPSGTVAWAEAGGVVVFYWYHLQQPGEDDGTTGNTVTLVLFAEGSFRVHWGDMNSTDGLVGWTCAPGGDVPDSDVSAMSAVQPEGSQGIGRGTEGAVYEWFESTEGEVFDLARRAVSFCGNAGYDDDGDSWSDACGDCDDADAGVYPGHGC